MLSIIISLTKVLELVNMIGFTFPVQLPFLQIYALLFYWAVTPCPSLVHVVWLDDSSLPQP